MREACSVTGKSEIQDKQISFLRHPGRACFAGRRKEPHDLDSMKSNESSTLSPGPGHFNPRPSTNSLFQNLRVSGQKELGVVTGPGEEGGLPVAAVQIRDSGTGGVDRV